MRYLEEGPPQLCFVGLIYNIEQIYIYIYIYRCICICICTCIWYIYHVQTVNLYVSTSSSLSSKPPFHQISSFWSLKPPRNGWFNLSFSAIDHLPGVAIGTGTQVTMESAQVILLGSKTLGAMPQMQMARDVGKVIDRIGHNWR